MERSFRLFYGSAEVARKLLLIQTHVPEHYALRAAVRGDYEAFAAAELPDCASLATRRSRTPPLSPSRVPRQRSSVR